MKSKFYTKLEVEKLSSKYWKITSDLVYYSELLDKTITVPKGFVTDFASIPKIPFIYSFLSGIGYYASVIHDLLYRWHLVSRKKSDLILKEALYAKFWELNQLTQLNKLKSHLIYYGVRIYGSFFYKNMPGCLDHRDCNIKDCLNCNKYYKEWNNCIHNG